MDAGKEDLSTLLEGAQRHAWSGELDRADALIVRARQCRPLRHGGWQAVEVMLVEGVVHTYRGQVDAARDRFRRVVALGSLLPSSDAAAQAWGWQALLDYNRGDVLAAAECSGHAYADPAPARPLTRLRLAVNAALLCEHAGLTGAARAWFSAARAVAPLCRLPAVLGTIAYDLAAVRLCEAAAQHWRRPTPPETARTLLLQVRSAMHFDAATGAQVQAPLHDLAQALALRLLGQPGEAIMLLERFIGQAQGIAQADRLSARLQLAICQLDLDRAHQDPTWPACVDAVLQQLDDPGEHAQAADLQARLAARAGDTAEEHRWRQRAHEALARHDERCNRLAERLATLNLEAVPPAWAVPGVRSS